MRRLFLTSVLFVITLTIANYTMADVLVVDSGVTTQEAFTTSLFVPTGAETNDEEDGDYVLLMCSTLSDGDNSFSDPTLGDWTEIDNGQCGNGGFEPGISCVHGIWGRFFGPPSEDNGARCNWAEEELVSVGGALRYRNVDTNSPIIASECDNGFGTTATAPSIESEAGAQVVRIVSFRFPEGISCGATDNIVTIISACENADVLNISFQAETEIDQTGGPTGEAVIPLEHNIGTPPANWRACTVALRMATRNIPTMSEWGFIAVAAFMGAAGVWYIRRKQQRA